MDLVGRAGELMLAAALALMLLGILASLPRALRVRRRLLGLQATMAQSRQELVIALDQLARVRREGEELSRPVIRLRRWLTHPLVAALLRSYLRRRRR